MQHEISRRVLMKRAVLAGALGLFGKQSLAATLVPLDANDPGATALGS
jgi:hypothetical protein